MMIIDTKTLDVQFIKLKMTKTQISQALIVDIKLYYQSNCIVGYRCATTIWVFIWFWLFVMNTQQMGYKEREAPEWYY